MSSPCIFKSDNDLLQAYCILMPCEHLKALERTVKTANKLKWPTDSCYTSRLNAHCVNSQWSQWHSVELRDFKGRCTAATCTLKHEAVIVTTWKTKLEQHNHYKSTGIRNITPYVITHNRIWQMHTKKCKTAEKVCQYDVAEHKSDYFYF